MTINPCDIYDYNSDEYNSCVKDVVYEAAQDEWIMLDPRFPNLKGVTPDKIDHLLVDAKRLDMKNYFEDYLQHVMVYDRDDIFKMCINLGEQIEEKYPDALHSPHSIFITTPRGGHEVLSIFAYANDLKKEQIPSHIKGIDKDEIRIALETKEREEKDNSESVNEIEDEDENEEYVELYYPFEEEEELAYYPSNQDIIDHYNKGNYPVIPDIWLLTDTFYLQNNILRVFIIDDIIASGDQMSKAYMKIEHFFKNKTEVPIHITPVVLIKAKNIEIDFLTLKNTIYDTETVGINNWDIARYDSKLAETGQTMSIGELEETIKIYESLITVRFPWGSPDGDSDEILTKLYEGRRGLDRMERKQRRCILEPDKCELK